MKRFVLICLILMLMLSLCAFSCRHDWIEASCTQPKTCTKCGASEGEAVAHEFSEPSCEQAATCAGCGLSEGEPLEHNFTGATYWDKGICTMCGAEGDVLEPGFEKAGFSCYNASELLNSPDNYTGIPYKASCYNDLT